MENYLELPSKEEFAKANSMIGEFLKPSSVKLSFVMKMAGNVVSSPVKDTTRPSTAAKPISPTLKSALQPLGTKTQPLGASKTQVK